MSYTKGPWKLVCNEDNISNADFEEDYIWGTIIAKNDYHIARIWKDVENGEEEAAANARLIAQAPATLKELKDMMWLANAAMLDANKCGCEYEIDEELKDARAIIRAAEGGE